MKQIKCPSCGHWIEEAAKACPKCGTLLTDSYKEEKEKRLVFERNPLPIIDVAEDAGFLEKLWKKPIQWGQLIFLTILSTIAAIASSTVH